MARVFCNEYVERHPLSNLYSADLEDLSFRDYHPRHYFKPGIKCIDLDGYAKSFHSGYTQETVDAVIGLEEKENRSRRYLLLVELRLDYDNMKNLKVANLKAKEDNSKQMLRLDMDINICPELFLLFKHDVIQQAERYVRNLSREAKRNWIAREPTQFVLEFSPMTR